MNAVLNWIAGIVATVLAGLAIFYLTQGGREPVAVAPPTASDRVTVVYDYIAGPFLILGPNPDGVWASPAGEETTHWWYSFAVSVSNECRDGRFHVSPRDVVLYLSETGEIAGTEALRPTSQGLEYQPRRLASAWVAPGGTLEGELVFRVHFPDAGSGPRPETPFIRLGVDFPCPVVYRPR